MRALLLLFVVMPIIEMWLLIHVAAEIGPLYTHWPGIANCGDWRTAFAAAGLCHLMAWSPEIRGGSVAGARDC